MDANTLIQTGSLLLVSVALIVNAFQLRHASKQSAALAQTLNQSAYGSMVTNATEAWHNFFSNDPALLAWHLSARGYKTSTPAINKRRLYAIVKLEEHEYNYRANEQGFLAVDVWQAWHNVMEVDFSIYEFQEIWPTAKRFYASSYVQYVDRHFNPTRRLVENNVEQSESQDY